MEPTKTLLLVIEISPLYIGDVFTKIPLHTTLVRWFHSPIDPRNLFTELKPIFEKYLPFDLVSDVQTLFGPNNNVHVHTLRHEPRLHALHNELLDFLGTKHIVVPSEYARDKYRPHVTSVLGVTFPPGSLHKATSVALLEKGQVDTSLKKVIERFQIGGLS
jgi:hypothetical protein